MVKSEYNIGKFNSIVFGNINKHINQSSEQIAMQGIIYLADIDFSRYAGECSLPGVNAEDSIFHGDVNFKGVRFDGLANFDRVKIFGRARFLGATFEKGVSFFSSEFGNEFNFNNVAVGGYAVFTFAVFKEDAELSFRDNWIVETGLPKREVYPYDQQCVSFEECIFEKNASLEGAFIDVEVYFTNVIFVGKLKLNYAVFKKDVSFRGATFRDDVSFVGKGPESDEPHLEHMLFDGKVDFREVNAVGAVKFEQCNLREMQFSGTKLKNIEFIGCYWPGKPSLKRIFDESCIVKDRWDKKLCCNYEKVESLYRQLKEKSVIAHDWAEVSNWHYNEKVIAMKRHFKDKNCLKTIAYFSYWSLSGFNERPIRAIASLAILLIVLGFAMPSEGVGQSIMDGLEYLPFIKTLEKQPSIVGGWRVAVIFFQTAITIQIALVVMSVRNKLRR